MECRAVAIRQGSESDLASICEIYNHYVVASPATLETVPWSREAGEDWLDQFSGHGPHRIYVADLDGVVVGFVASSRLDEKVAYSTSVKTSAFVAPAYCGRGLGRRLYDHLFEALQEEDLHRAFAEVTLPNNAALNVHRSLGFEQTGLLKEAARKFGRYWDVLWLSRRMP